MKRVLILCSMLVLSACVGETISPCTNLGGGITKCNYPGGYCIESVRFVYGQGIIPMGFQCFETENKEQHEKEEIK